MGGAEGISVADLLTPNTSRSLTLTRTPNPDPNPYPNPNPNPNPNPYPNPNPNPDPDAALMFLPPCLCGTLPNSWRASER